MADVENRVAQMNALFAAHDKNFRHHPCDVARCRKLDAQAQAIKAELLAEGVNLIPDQKGYFHVGQ